MNVMNKNEKNGVYLTQVSGMPAVCFLTFHRPVSIYSNEVVDWQAGAYQDPETKRWEKINDRFVEQNKAHFIHNLLWDFSLPTSPRPAYLDLFSETICKYMDGFTHDERQKYVKGRTFGNSMENGPGVVMKALKTGFDALGIVKSAYGGWRISRFTAEDIAPYVKRMIKDCMKFLDGNLYRGFEGVTPIKVSVPKNPGGYLRAWHLDADRGKDMPGPLYGDHIQNTVLKDYTPTQGRENTSTVGEDHNFRSPLKNPHGGYVRVSEYGFRGDSRPPVDIKALGGMNPNAVRDDRQKERGKLEVLNNFDHQASWGSAYSGYVSWSRNIGTAYKFMKTPPRGDGWIYAARCRDAVDVAATFTNPRYQEYEISVPGGTEWSEIVGWRKVCYNPKGRFWFWDSKVYLTTDQQILPKAKRAEILKLFSWPLKHVAEG